MNTLVLMCVFYDKNGDIKAITPILDENFSINFSSATFPLAEVEMFLTAQSSTFDYQVKQIDKVSGTTYKIVKKQTNVTYTRTLDSYLTKVDDVKRHETILTITNITDDSVISVEINKDFKELYIKNECTEEQQESIATFFTSGPSVVYLTKKNNPYHLLFSFTFTPIDLIRVDKLYFNYTGDYTDTSVYTKKLIIGYGYKETNKKKQLRIQKRGKKWLSDL